MCGIYKILNIHTNKFYIGSALDFDKRRKEHFNLLAAGKHPNRHLQNAYNKYGKDSFTFEILEQTESLVEREQYYLDTLQPFGKIGYNICRVAYSALGVKRTAETKKRLSDAKKGDKNPMYGKTFTDDTKKRLSESKSGQKHWSFGKPCTEQQKLRISKGCSGKEISDDTRNKLSESGKKAWTNRKSQSQRVSINGKIYNSVREAAKAIGINKDSVSYRCKQAHYTEYKFIK